MRQITTNELLEKLISIQESISLRQAPNTDRLEAAIARNDMEFVWEIRLKNSRLWGQVDLIQTLLEWIE